MKRPLVIGILIFLIILFSALSRLWIGMGYFSLVALISVCIYCFVIKLYDYRVEFYGQFEEKYKLYVAKLINSSSLSLQDFEDGKKVYIKKFKKTLIKDKIIQIGIMLVLLSVAIIALVYLMKGIIG